MYKNPVSVLVVIHTRELEVLLMERADRPGFWQSVTGSRHDGEALSETALREVREETGIDASRHWLSDWGIENRFEILPRMRRRYAPEVTFNAEHVFGLLLGQREPITLAPEEHTEFAWLPWAEAAQKTPSWSNAAAIHMLPQRIGQAQ